MLLPIPDPASARWRGNVTRPRWAEPGLDPDRGSAQAVARTGACRYLRPAAGRSRLIRSALTFPEDTFMELLRLAALDAEDLTVISAHLQDAILRPEDLTYLAGEHRFLMVARRFAGVHFERVLTVKTRGLKPGDAMPMSLLALTFTPTNAPSGHVDLVFSG